MADEFEVEPSVPVYYPGEEVVLFGRGYGIVVGIDGNSLLIDAHYEDGTVIRQSISKGSVRRASK